MTPRIIVLLLAMGLTCRAETPLKLTLAIPHAEGRISVGVFDTAGKLVRKLGELEDLQSFEIGLNGLILSWDAKDDDGQPVSPGTYRVRGWFVPPEVAVEGEAFHFNTWADAEGVPPVSRVISVIPTQGDDFFLVGMDAIEDRPAVWQADAKAVLGGKRFLPEGSVFLAGDGQSALVRIPAGLGLFALSGEEKIEVFEGTASLAALSGSQVAWVADGGSELFLLDRANLASKPTRLALPFQPRFLIALQGGFLVSDGSRVGMVGDGGVTDIPMGDPLTVESLAPGPGGSFWLTGMVLGEPAFPVVRNVRLTGELLRELKLSAIDTGNLVFSSATATGFYLLASREGVSTFRGLHPLASPTVDEGPVTPGPQEPRFSDWEEFVVRTIEPCREFGFQNGVPAPSGPFNTTIKIALAEDPLSSKKATLTAQLVFDSSGAWLAAEGGLKILPVWEATRIHRVVVAPGKAAGSAWILIGQPAFAAGFFATGLQNISPLEGGDVEVLP
jgi:hypothetical protein